MNSFRTVWAMNSMKYTALGLYFPEDRDRAGIELDRNVREWQRLVR